MAAPLIRLENVSFSYKPGRPVLTGASLDIREGERVALTGCNGAGKTTCLHLMVGLLRPESGRIEAFGAERKVEKDFLDVRARAGLLFQDAEDQLFCPRVVEDVAFGPLNLGLSAPEAKAVVSETLAMLGLGGFENRITHHLSAGEKRLVSLAAVLAMKPDLLLLDEPTAALDEKALAQVTGVLKGLTCAMLIVSHDPAFLSALATRSVALRDGAFSDTPAP
jgi:cobalt/nickel transport system ATP-binding protein